MADLDRSIAFYGLLGYEVIARWVRTEEYLRELVGYPTVEMHAAVLRHDRVGVFLELLEYRNIERKSRSTRRTATPAPPTSACSWRASRRCGSG